MDSVELNQTGNEVLANKPGYVGRMKGGIDLDSDGVEFLISKRTRVEKRFPSRLDAIKYLREVEHFAVDDLKYMYWYQYGEDIRREVLTGEYIDEFFIHGDILLAQNYWECDGCGRVYRKLLHFQCPICRFSHWDCPDARADEMYDNDLSMVAEEKKARFRKVVEAFRRGETSIKYTVLC
jgi:hypothetical protein